MFEAIEEEDRVIENNEGLPPALLGSCNDRARQLHALPSGLWLSLSLFGYFCDGLIRTACLGLLFEFLIHNHGKVCS